MYEDIQGTIDVHSTVTIQWLQEQLRVGLCYVNYGFWFDWYVLNIEIFFVVVFVMYPSVSSICLFLVKKKKKKHPLE